MPPKFRRPAGVLGPVAKAAAKAGAAKAKAKAGVKAKARPKRGARDRGRRDRGRDRGGAGDRGAEVDVAFNKEDFLKGVEFSAALVPISEWKKGLRLVLSEASYWEEKLQVAGVLEKVEFDGEAVTAYLSLEGTTGEGLVKWKGKYPGQLLSVHFCPKDCGKVSKDGLAHCEKVRLLKPELEEAWMRNLMGMERPEGKDELEALRMRSGEVGLGGAPPGVKKKKRGSASESEISSGEKRSGRKDKRKKKKKSASSKEKKKKVSGTKSLEAVFGTTGLDPDPTSRKKVLRRAKKLAKKKARRSSSSSESSTSSESSLSGGEGVVITPPETESFYDYGTVELKVELNSEDFLKAGSSLNSGEGLPTFTTSRPRTYPGTRPAGLWQCTEDEVALWQGDLHRYPPYQYRWKNLITEQGDCRLPNIGEKEVIMGFPLQYTATCLPKSKQHGSSYLDCRHTLIGNTWNVQVVAWLLANLFYPLGFTPIRHPHEVVSQVLPEVN